jgi:dsRNA-specific ribonuclease
VKRSKRQELGIMKPETLKLTITAIIGAIFLDSGFNHREVEAVMERIG